MKPLSDIETTELLFRAEAGALAGAMDSPESWGPVQELHGRPSKETFEVACSWCRSADPALRVLGADVLGQLGSSEAYPFGPESEPLLQRLTRDPEPVVAASALIALGHLQRGDALEIAMLASHPDPRVRYAVAVCLGPRSGDEALEALIHLSSDEDLDVRNWATFGLGSMREDDTPALREALDARLSDPDFEVRGEALLGLAIRGARHAIPAVLNELRTTAATLAVEAAGAFADPVFLRELDRLLRENPQSSELLEARAKCARGPTPVCS